MRFLILFILIFTHSLGFAAQKQNLRCVTTHYPPFTIYDAHTNSFTGIDIGYLKHFEQTLNVTIDVVHLPWARVQKEMKTSQYDCYFSLAYNEERAKYLSFTNIPLHTTKYGVFKVNNTPLKTDLSDAVIAVLRGVTLPDVIIKKYAINDDKLMRSLSTVASFQLLNKGRVDYVITNYEAGLWYSKNNKNITATELNEYQLPVYIAFKPGVINISQVNTQIKHYQASQI